MICVLTSQFSFSPFCFFQGFDYSTSADRMCIGNLNLLAEIANKYLLYSC